MTSGHKVWPSPSLFQRQRWDPLDRRSTLVSPEGAWGPECWQASRGWRDSCWLHIDGPSLSWDKRQRLTWQFGDRKSHSRLVLSNEPEINVSSTGDIERDVTLNQEIKRQSGKETTKGFCQLWSKGIFHFNTSLDDWRLNRGQVTDTTLKKKANFTFYCDQESSECICCHEGKGTW